MKYSLIGAAVATLVLSSFASAATLTGYSFESATAPSGTPTTSGPIAADTATGTFTGVHAAAATFSTPAGNGSTKSFSSNGWAVGDYWQFTADTTGVTGVKVQFDMVGSSTGPANFKIQYSTTGTGGTFTDLAGGTYTLDSTSFSSGTVKTTTPPRFLFDLSSIAALNNNANAAFRLVDTSTTSINNGTVAATGTNRVDNILVGLVPEPATLGLIAGGLTLVARRRKA